MRPRQRHPRPYGGASPYQNPDPDPSIFLQNPNAIQFPFSPQFFEQQQFFPQNPNFQNPFIQTLVNVLPQSQDPNFQNFQNPFAQPPPAAAAAAAAPPPRPPQVTLESVESAVAKAQRDLVAAGENVTAWKVSQAALLSLQVDSWSSLGFQLQDVPSLRQLLATEGKNSSYDYAAGQSYPYPSAAEEMKRLGLKFDTGEKDAPLKDKLMDVWSRSSDKGKSLSKKQKRKLLEQRQEEHDNSMIKSLRKEEFNDYRKKLWNVTLHGGFMKNFVTTWKEACQEHSALEVLDLMIDFYRGSRSEKKKRQLRKIFSSFPCGGLLCVAVSLFLDLLPMIFRIFQWKFAMFISLDTERGAHPSAALN